MTKPSETVEQRLAPLGYTLPAPSTPFGVYRAAVRSGELIYVSGQVAVRDGRIVHPGRLGVNVSVEQGQEAARVATLNALAAASVLAPLEELRVVRLVGHVASAPTFTQQPAVIDGASELLRDALGERQGVGARLAIGVAALPAESPVELELIFEAPTGT